MGNERGIRIFREDSIQVTKNTNIVFASFSSGMTLDLVLTQDATGGWGVSFSGCTLIGTINTTSLVNTWLKCYKVGTTTFVEVRASFIS